MNQLPAHLANLPVSGLAARAAEGIGSALPPHISIRGNQFTLVDAAGNKQTAQTTFLDVCIADISDVMCKMYYGDENGPKKWTPDSDDPPACWSANGVAPSSEAISPQSPRCDSCEWNKRGSAQSMEGKPTKACRDEKRMALLVPGIPMPLQFTLTPGSFTNFRAYTEMFKGKPIDMCHILTRLTFEQGVNGILTFGLSPLGYIDEATAAMYVRMRETKASDVLVGRNDRPRQVALTAPVGTMGGQTTGAAGNVPTTGVQGQTQPQGFQPGPFVQTPAQNAGGTGQSTQSGAPTAGATSPSSQPQAGEQPRRRRRTAEQIAADNAAAAGGAPQGQTPATGGQAFQQPAGASQAPFAQPSAATGAGPPFGAPTPAAGGAPFGIAQNPPPPPAGLDAALDALFNSPASGGQGA